MVTKEHNEIFERLRTERGILNEKEQNVINKNTNSNENPHIGCMALTLTALLVISIFPVLIIAIFSIIYSSPGNILALVWIFIPLSMVFLVFWVVLKIISIVNRFVTRKWGSKELPTEKTIEYETDEWN